MLKRFSNFIFTIGLICFFAGCKNPVLDSVEFNSMPVSRSVTTTIKESEMRVKVITLASSNDRVQFKLKNVSIKKGDEISFKTRTYGAKSVCVRDGAGSNTKWLNDATFGSSSVKPLSGRWDGYYQVTTKATNATNVLGFTFKGAAKVGDRIYIDDLKIGSNTITFTNYDSSEISNWKEWSQPASLSFAINTKTIEVESETQPENESEGTPIVVETGSKTKQSISYSDANKKLNNPDQGFYNAIDVAVKRSGISNLSSLKSEIKYADYNLIHLKMDISDFSKNVNKSKDYELTSQALSDIDALLKSLYSAEKTTIIRFAYDKNYDGHGTKKSPIEPDISMIHKHIEALALILNKNKNVITAIETGLFGPWGEMHTTPYGENYDLISEAVNKLLVCTSESNIPVLVRKPAFIYTYLKNYKGVSFSSKSSIPYYELSENEDINRLGLYNDGYLGSSSDLGTYLSGNRSKEVELLKQFTNRTPYGGEVCTYVDDNGVEKLDKAIWDNLNTYVPEMFDMNLSFLNIDWNDSVIARWKTDYSYNGEAAFDYIEKHFGYRYLITDSEFSRASDNSSLKIELSIENKGFGNLLIHRAKQMKLIFVNESTRKTEYTKDLKTLFTGQSKIDETISVSLPAGISYNVFLKVCDSDGKYNIAFANSSMYDSSLKANKIGKF